MLLLNHCVQENETRPKHTYWGKNVENKYLNISTKIPIFISFLKSAFWQAIEN